MVVSGLAARLLAGMISSAHTVRTTLTCAFEDSGILTQNLGDTYSQKQYPKTPDDDPMDFEGHGTHIAGIIAADNDW